MADPHFKDSSGNHFAASNHLVQRVLGIVPHWVYHGTPAGANMPTFKSVVRCDPEVLGGTPVFAGTRVPVKICWITSPPATASIDSSIIFRPSLANKPWRRSKRLRTC